MYIKLSKSMYMYMCVENKIKSLNLYEINDSCVSGSGYKPDDSLNFSKRKNA